MIDDTTTVQLEPSSY